MRPALSRAHLQPMLIGSLTLGRGVRLRGQVPEGGVLMTKQSCSNFCSFTAQTNKAATAPVRRWKWRIAISRFRCKTPYFLSGILSLMTDGALAAFAASNVLLLTAAEWPWQVCTAPLLPSLGVGRHARAQRRRRR